MQTLKHFVIKNESVLHYIKYSQSFPIKQIRKYIRNKNIKSMLPLKEVLDYYPKRIAIETTNYCNTNCSFCPHDKMKREMKVMDDELYKNLLLQIKDMNVEEIYLGFIGEPLLDKKLPERISLAKSIRIKSVNIFTNAIFLTEEKVDKLIDSKVDKIIISLDAFSDESYKKIRSFGSYQKVIQNINYLLENKNGTRVDVGLLLLGKEYKAHIPEFLKKWKDADNVLFRLPHNWAGRVNAVEEQKIKKSNLPCYSLWTQMNVLSNGKVVPCCMDMDAELTVGDATKNLLEEIWNSKMYQNLRRLHIQGKENKIDLCKKCDISYSNTLPWWYYE